MFMGLFTIDIHMKKHYIVDVYVYAIVKTLHMIHMIWVKVISLEHLIGHSSFP